jgi:hypothetical protein
MALRNPDLGVLGCQLVVTQAPAAAAALMLARTPENIVLVAGWHIEIKVGTY